MKKICIINTGGTIGMSQSPQGLRPEQGYLARQMAQMPELTEEELPRFEVVEFDPLLDSSDMTPDAWLKIAHCIAENYLDVDGFVVLHGTDTMAYTSSALSFMLEGLAKPVILTGAQIPLGRARNDARENLKTAMILAGSFDIPEVCLFFGEVLLRGCRATKISATKLDAFASPNFPLLGSAETTIEVFQNRIRKPGPEPKLHVESIGDAEVATFRLFPGMSMDILSNLLRRPLQGLVIESFGVGNGPAKNKEFLDVLGNAVQQGTVIVNCSQCGHGSVSQTNYAAGSALDDVGVVSGHDMTIESALAKLLYLFSGQNSVATIREKLVENLVGELTPCKIDN